MDKIGIIGTGNIGEAIIKAIIKNGIKKESILCTEIKPERAKQIENMYKVTFTESVEEMIKKTKYVILSIKPQDSKVLLGRIAPVINDKKVIISVMAGITISNILSAIGKPVKIVRTMPNICVKVGEGAIGITSNSYAEVKDLEFVKTLFSSLGKTVEIGEELMDAMTALSGSGPAFFLLFLEGMIDAGVKMGFTRDKSKIICTQVIKGTMKMLEEEGIHPTLMREMVTSPAGTTIAGLASLEESAFKGAIIKAIEKAMRRAKELSL